MLANGLTVTLAPLVNSEIEQGRPSASLATSDNRVSSLRSAKTDAWVCRFAATVLRCFGDIGLDILHLLGPTALVSEEGFEAKASTQSAFRYGRSFMQPPGCIISRLEKKHSRMAAGYNF